MDAGTFEGMLDASNFISTFEKRQGYKIACLEEIAFNNNWIRDNSRNFTNCI